MKTFLHPNKAIYAWTTHIQEGKYRFVIFGFSQSLGQWIILIITNINKISFKKEKKKKRGSDETSSKKMQAKLVQTNEAKNGTSYKLCNTLASASRNANLCVMLPMTNIPQYTKLSFFQPRHHSYSSLCFQHSSSHFCHSWLCY